MPTVIDLFAGAGGLSLGAARAGFNVSASVETDVFALSTHRRNFPASIHVAEDVACLTGKRLLSLAGLKNGELDGLIGGPPCQGFSTMGKRDVDDQRNNLFDHFFRLVKETKPKFYVAENVPGILDDRYCEIRQKAFSQLPRRYVQLPPVTIQANLYGAPTTRTRVFFIGYDPAGFSRQLSEQDFLPAPGFDVVNVAKALKGLPEKINSEWISEEQGWRRVKELDGSDWFYELTTGRVPKNVGDPSSIARYSERLEVSGCMGTRHTAEVVERFRTIKAGKVDAISKAIRLDPHGFCPTLRAGTAKEKGSYQAVRPIHYSQPRVITPREAARLQGFPDWFVFHETKWHSFRQIGNSVSPIVGEAVLTPLFRHLT